MKTFDRYVTPVLAAIFCLTLLICTPAYAKVKGVCANCHTMHNSENGSSLAGGPNAALTKGNCVGCHTGDNVTGGDTPFVMSVNNPDGSSLAGGNFYWVSEVHDNRGHNVGGIPTMTVDEALIAGAPGGADTCSDTTCHVTLFEPEGLDTGCEGCHLDTKHHAPQQAEGAPALEENGYFRFLSGHMGGLTGVHGIEDDAWELDATIYKHNEYLGSEDNVTNTMTGYCVGCHGLFHDQKNTNGDWIRHPSDAVIPTTGEYAAAINGEYDINVPVARADLTNIAQTSLIGEGDMVMCLSCHRAHGSPYPDSLRWNYTGMIAGGGDGCNTGNGCFKCHSEKD